MRYLFVLIILACVGCSALPHLDELFVLKGYSDDKEAQDAYVKDHDARFEEMLRQADRPEEFALYGSRKVLESAFGEAVLCRMDGALEKCLYRRIIRPLQSPKVYFYFDAQGGVVRWNRTGG